MANELQREEKIIWADYPKSNFRFQPGDKFAIPFSLVWTGMAAFMSGKAIEDKFYIMVLVPVLFFVIGLYLVFGRFFMDIFSRKRIYYCLTNRRIVIIRKLWSLNILSKDLSSLTHIDIRVNSKGVGSIFFSENANPNAAFSWPGMSIPFCFDYLNDVRTIYNLIKDAKDMVT